MGIKKVLEFNDGKFEWYSDGTIRWYDNAGSYRPATAEEMQIVIDLWRAYPGNFQLEIEEA